MAALARLVISKLMQYTVKWCNVAKRDVCTIISDHISVEFFFLLCALLDMCNINLGISFPRLPHNIRNIVLHPWRLTD